MGIVYYCIWFNDANVVSIQWISESPPCMQPACVYTRGIKKEVLDSKVNFDTHNKVNCLCLHSL